MKHEKMAGKKPADLQRLEGELKEKLFQFKLKQKTGQLKEIADLGKTRRAIARVKTELRHQELQVKRT